MPSELRDRLNDQIKVAMKGGFKERLAVLRFISAGLKQQEIDTRTELDDTAIIAILTKMANQRRESITQFDAAGRTDLADKERDELKVVEEFLPAALSAAEIEDCIAQALAASGATTIKDMGRVMNTLRPQLMGRADLAAVSALVKQRLGG